MKKLQSILCMAMAVGVLAASIPAASAAQNTFTVKNVGIVRFGMQEIEPGGTYTAADGEEVPAVVTYTDAQGKDTNYLPVRLIADLMDTPIQWNAEKQSVALGSITKSTTAAAETTVSNGTATVTTSTPSTYWQSTPVYGTTAGPFTEIDPDTFKYEEEWKHTPRVMELKSNKGTPTMVTTMLPGCYQTISVTNNGTEQQKMWIYRQPAGSAYDKESFTTVSIDPGETLTRVFYLDSSADALATNLQWNVKGGSNTDITVSITDYTPVADSE